MTENDFYCDLCLREDLKKRGIVYCYNCLEILCKECERHHKKNKASISHKLMDISRNAIEWNTTDYDYYEQHSKCPKHGLKYVKFLCKTHGEFCCEKCAKIEDKKCRLVDEVELNTELKKTLEYMKQTADKLIEHESNYRTKLDAEKKEAQTCLENLKAHIDYSYEKIKNKILTEMLARRRDLSSASLLQTASVEKLKAEIRSSREVVEDATIQHKIPCFLLLREVQQELQEYEEKLIQHKQKTSSVTVSVVERASVLDMYEEINKFVCIEDTAMEPTCFDMMLSHDPGERRVVCEEHLFIDEWKIEKCSPRYCLWINNYLVVSMQEERALKLFNAMTGTIISTYQCNSQPWAMTKMDNLGFAVAFPYRKTISTMTVFKRYLKDNGSPIRTSLEVWALSYMKTDKTLLAASREGGFVQKYKIDGEDAGTIQLESDGDGIYNLTYDDISGYLYISYNTSNKVVCVDKTGAEIFQYSPLNIRNPWSVVPDKEDNVCITYYNGNCIQQLNKKGRLLNEIVPSDGEEIVHPLGMCFNERKNRFALLCAKLKCIKIFKF